MRWGGDTINRDVSLYGASVAGFYGISGGVIGGINTDAGGATQLGSRSGHRTDLGTGGAIGLSLSTNSNVSLGGLVGGGAQLSLTSSGRLGWDSGSGSIDASLYRSGAASLATDSALTVSKALRSGFVNLPFSNTVQLDAALGNTMKITLAGDVASSTISNGQAGEFLTLLVCQDSTGGHTMQWPSNLRLSGGSFATTSAAYRCDSLTAVYDGAIWYETARSSNL